MAASNSLQPPVLVLRCPDLLPALCRRRSSRRVHRVRLHTRSRPSRVEAGLDELAWPGIRSDLLPRDDGNRLHRGSLDRRAPALAMALVRAIAAAVVESSRSEGSPGIELANLAR